MDIFDSYDDKNKDTINVCKIKVYVRDHTMQICAQWNYKLYHIRLSSITSILHFEYMNTGDR
jgi:hypothetical protein